MYSVTQSTLIEQLNSDNGLCRSLQATVTIDSQSDRAHEFMERLLQFRDAAPEATIRQLYEYQVQAASNIAYRPRLLTVFRPQTTHDLPTTVTSQYLYEARGPDQDIGSVALNDMFTGSGKTLVSLLAAIEVATARRSEICNKAELLMREQTTHVSWLTGMHDRCPPPYSDVIAVFCPKHLAHQWQRAAGHALHIMGVQASVYINPLKQVLTAAAAAQQEGQLVIAIYDSVKKAKGSLAFVPCIITDEFVMQGEHNFATRSFDESKSKSILFGRLILVSADAGNVGRILMSLRNACLVKRWASITSNSWTYSTSIIHMAGASSLSTAARGEICSSMGLQTPIYIHQIRYVPTVGGIVFGSAFEVSQKSGVEQFEQMGVAVRDCTTTDDIIAAVQQRLDQPVVGMQDNADEHGRVPPQQALLVAQDRRIREMLIGCLHRMSRFSHVGDCYQCPICYDDLEASCMIQPCWHVICKKCMQTYLQNTDATCPMCRTAIHGHLTALTKPAVLPAAAAAEQTSFGASIADSLASWAGPAPGLFKAVGSVLLCLEHHNRIDTPDAGCFRVIVAVPDGIEFDALCEQFHQYVPVQDAWLSHFRTVGSVQHRISGTDINKQLQQFTSDEGARFKVLFTSEGSKDSMIGLDLPTVDALVSVGDGNDAQRIGRLTRLGRTFTRGHVHHFDLQQQ
jgi:hypothetical protein